LTIRETKGNFVNNCIGFAPWGNKHHLAVKMSGVGHDQSTVSICPVRCTRFENPMFGFLILNPQTQSLLAVPDHSRVEYIDSGFTHAGIIAIDTNCSELCIIW